MKICNICGVPKDFSQFARRSDERADGYQAHCLECQAEKNRRHYEANREVLRARALARKQAIKAGTYHPDKTAHLSRTRHEVEVIPPKIALTPIVFRFDEAEEAYIKSESERREIRVNDVVRELVRAGMAARASSKRKRK